MSGKNLVNIETLFTALADKTRLRLLNLIRYEEVCVCFFVEVLGESQPKISRHLAYLRKTGLVTARREGKWMHYKLNPPKDEGARRILEETIDALGKQPGMRKEFENLVEACCSPQAPVTISKAPKPDALVESNVNTEAEELETFLL